jgi:hypothetical protein
MIKNNKQKISIEFLTFSLFGYLITQIDVSKSELDRKSGTIIHALNEGVLPP